MSETTALAQTVPVGEPTIVTPPTLQTAPLVSASPADQSTAAASSTSAAAIVVIIMWGLKTAGVMMPPDVAVAFVAIIGTLVHYVMLKYGMNSLNNQPTETK